MGPLVRVLWALPVVAAMTLAVPTSAVAQPYLCGEIMKTCGQGGGEIEPHTFVEHVSGENWREPHDVHGECKDCFVVDAENDTTLAEAEYCHWPNCDPSEQQDEEEQLAYLKAIGAAAHGDVDEVLPVAIRYHGAWLSINEERRSIQLLDCSRESVVANLPLDDARYHRAMARLRSPPAVPGSVPTLPLTGIRASPGG